jgi:hypothetical protein
MSIGTATNEDIKKRMVRKGRGSIPPRVYFITGPAIPQIAATNKRYMYAFKR